MMSTRPTCHRIGTKFNIFALSLIVLLAATAYAGGWIPLAGESAGSESAGAVTQEAARPDAHTPVNREKVIEGETVTLTPRGFEPAEVARSGGHFALSVDNRSGLRDVTFVLSRESGHKLREVRVKEGKLNWREVVRLPPGSYRLSEAGRPEWVCRIEISPR